MEDLVAEVVARHPELVQAALERAATTAALGKMSIEETSTSPELPADKGKAEAASAKGKGVDATSRAVPAEPSYRQNCPQFTMDTTYQQRELEKLAAAYMDGYENGAT